PLPICSPRSTRGAPSGRPRPARTSARPSRCRRPSATRSGPAPGSTSRCWITKGSSSAARRVLVTGATGFVGANLVRRLLRDGHTLHLLVQPGYTRWRLEGIRARVVLHEVYLGDAARVAGVR